MRLSQHIEKGNEDGLFISCVASCSNLWALIMDAGTGFTAQVYELSPCFLHKVCLFSMKKIINHLGYFTCEIHLHVCFSFWSMDCED